MLRYTRYMLYGKLCTGTGSQAGRFYLDTQEIMDGLVITNAVEGSAEHSVVARSTIGMNARFNNRIKIISQWYPRYLVIAAMLCFAFTT